MMKSVITYELMHKERIVAQVSTVGEARLFCEEFLPYDIYLEEEEDIDARLNNLENFYHWCATRVLPLDRVYAKEILNSIGVNQATTDRERAQLALSYHCVSLTDVFWVRRKGEEVTFSELNIYDHSLNEALVALPLFGRQMSATNRELAQDLSTNGFFPKAWLRTPQGFQLLKDGGEDAVRKEVLASMVAQCFAIPQVCYHKGRFLNMDVSVSELITSKEVSIVSKHAFDIYACNHNLDTLAICRSLDPLTYYGMNIVDYLVGNTDRHPENWGFLIDNETNQWTGLYPLMDFNCSFGAYDRLDGANCQTVLPRILTQREAAVEAVRAIGLPQIREIDLAWFGEWTKEAEMFQRRLALLRRETIVSYRVDASE